MKMMNGAIERLVLQSRRRILLRLLLEESARALTLALCGATLLLVAGTEILKWYWPVILLLGALGYGWFRVSKRVPDPYRTAQQLDRNLGLHDLISTAFHYLLPGSRVLSSGIRDAQRAAAERRAASVDPAAVFPYALPKSIRWAAVAGMLMLGLLSLRYGIQHSLDLSRPLVAFEMNPFSGGVKQNTNRRNPGPAAEDIIKTLSMAPENNQQEGLAPAPDSEFGDAENPDQYNVNEQPVAGDKSTDKRGPGAGDTNDSEGGDMTDGTPQGKNGDPNSDNNAGKDGDSSERKAEQPGESSSMLDKMRDAFANMMEKLSLQDKNQQSGAQNQQAKSNAQSANARQQQSKSGMQTKGQAASGEASNRQEQEQGGESDPSQSTEGKPGERDAQSANQENKSGMGTQDGDKDVKLAEQLEAMGKISEIIGKRNANLQGEVMIEVNASKQALRTQYTQRSARHVDSGGEIHRDEVPLVFQSYVQHYFDEIRKAPAAPTPAKPAAAKPVVSEMP